eukprot:scaffold3396_cov49-Cyclotella_meneghiniana.AAC.4
MASVWEIRWTEESQDGEVAGAVESSRRGVVVERRAGRRMVVREFMVNSLDWRFNNNLQR